MHQDSNSIVIITNKYGVLVSYFSLTFFTLGQNNIQNTSNHHPPAVGGKGLYVRYNVQVKKNLRSRISLKIVFAHFR